jgi:predicted SnoaL-like aldol condensation-catalyzing enzyme
MWNRQLMIGLIVFTLTLSVMGVGMCAPINESEEAREEQNKAIVLRVYDEAFGQGKTEVINELFSEDYIQHNPMVPNGPEGLIGYIEMLESMDPAPVLTVKHILADGNLVVVHWHSSTTPDNESTGQAGFDIFRLDNGTIVEHWDTIQDVLAKTASGNSMFNDLYKYANGVQNLTEEQEEANKQLVINAYDGVFNGRRLGLLDQFWAGDDYIQHNPQITNGTAGLKASFDAFFPEGSWVQLRHAVADRDLVFTHSQALAPWDDQNNEFTGVAVGDLFRVVDGKIVEHWDVIQPVPATTASGNSMFSDLYKGADAQ